MNIESMLFDNVHALRSSLFPNETMSAVYQKQKTVRKKQGVLYRQQSICFPSFLNFVYGGILTFLCSAILAQARRIVNGF